MMLTKVWKKNRVFGIEWPNMTAMSAKSRVVLCHKFISNIGEMLKIYVWAKTEGFLFIGELDRLKFGVYNKSV